MKQITEHRHCKRCGKVMYKIEDGGEGHFMTYCTECCDILGISEIWIPSNL